METNAHTPFARSGAAEIARRAVAAVASVYSLMVIAALRGPRVDAGKVLRLSLKMGREIRKALRDYHVIYLRDQRQALSETPALRAQVYSDLGGRPAMNKWKARHHAARVGAAFRTAQAGRENNVPDPYPARPTSQRSAPQKLWTPTTDRTGAFRLAVIKTGARKTGAINPAPKLMNARRRVTSIRTYRFKPIEITPDDLQDIVPEYCERPWARPGPDHPPPDITLEPQNHDRSYLGP